jgi:hypothetical protein
VVGRRKRERWKRVVIESRWLGGLPDCGDVVWLLTFLFIRSPSTFIRFPLRSFVCHFVHSLFPTRLLTLFFPLFLLVQPPPYFSTAAWLYTYPPASLQDGLRYVCRHIIPHLADSLILSTLPPPPSLPQRHSARVLTQHGQRVCFVYLTPT